MKNSTSATTRVVRGLLKHSPQDVKSTDAWLGREFMVGETQILATEEVPRDELMKMVGRQVEIKGSWNEGRKWEPAQPGEEGFDMQTPSFAEGVGVVIGAGIEASSVVPIEN